MDEQQAVPSTNGAHVAVVDMPVVAEILRPKRVGKITREVTIPEGTYEGFKFRYWKTFPYKLQQDMQGNDETVANDAFRKVVLWHSGLELPTGEVDENGDDLYEPLPQPDNPTFREKLPFELLVSMMGLILKDVRELPNFLTRNS